MYAKIGLIFLDAGDYPKALSWFEQSLELTDEIEDNQHLKALIFEYIATLYRRQQSHEKAMDYYEKGLQLAEEIGWETRIASIQAGIGKSYHDQRIHEKAVEHYQEAFATAQHLEINGLVADLLKNLDAVYKAMGQSGVALEPVDPDESGFKNESGIVKKQEDDDLLPVYMPLD